MAREIPDWKAFGDVIRENLTNLVVVFFKAQACPKSNDLMPVVDELAAKYPDVVFMKVDKGDASDVAGYCNIGNTPTFQFYNRGKKEKDLNAPTGDELRAMVEKLK